ncbi:MAG: D-alanyl-D-alanine carboxypeptidase [Parcubacteria group bacterium]|nr:D-alanyl-D-alanine carboxypeptidase [Parcubacteria group bacterium]
MSDFKKPTIILVFVSFLTVFFAVVFFSSVFMLEAPKPAQEIAAVSAAKITDKKIIPDPFKDISIEAKAAYVFDVRTDKVLFALNEEAQLPLASLTKVMTALVASQIPEDTVISLASGEEWSLKELLEYTLVVSSNEGASAIAGSGGAVFGTNHRTTGTDGTDVFVKKMNDEARALHLAETFFLNPSGLDVDGTLSGAYGSAKDMALLFSHIAKQKPTLLEATAYDSLHFSSLSGNSHAAQNTNIIARAIPGLFASKTGYTDLAGGNLAIAFDVGPLRPVVIALLGSSQDGRFTDMGKLVEASIQKIGQGE